MRLSEARICVRCEEIFTELEAWQNGKKVCPRCGCSVSIMLQEITERLNDPDQGE